MEVTLVGAKSAACVLFSLYKVASLSLSQWGQVLTAVSYVVGPVVPWCILLLL